MFFAASKILFFIFQPSSLFVIVIAAGLALTYSARWRTIGRRVSWSGLALLVATGLLPLGNLLLLPLEERFALRQDTAPGDAAGIILLGGFEDGWVTSGRGRLAVNEAAERLIETVRLARQMPAAKIVFTGGVGSFFSHDGIAGPMQRFLTDAGIADDRIVIETKSRNTQENAAFTRELVQPKPNERWLLVTSAYHMPRAVGTFRAAGFDVVAYPVDFRTRDAADFIRPFQRIGDGLQRTDLAVKEWIGLVIYYLSGRSDALLPGPRSDSSSRT